MTDKEKRLQKLRERIEWLKVVLTADQLREGDLVLVPRNAFYVQSIGRRENGNVEIEGCDGTLMSVPPNKEFEICRGLGDNWFLDGGEDFSGMGPKS